MEALWNLRREEEPDQHHLDQMVLGTRRDSLPLVAIDNAL